jgi:hypothetical protein
MAGDRRVRFCPHCRQNVYNLSGMSKEQATALLREKERTPCVRFYRRRDGTVMTADCPVGIRQIAGHAWGWTAMTWAALIAFGLGLLGWAVGRPRATMGAVGPSSSAGPGGSESRQGVTMGEIERPPRKAGAELDREQQAEGKQQAANGGDPDGPGRGPMIILDGQGHPLKAADPAGDGDDEAPPRP